MSAHDLLLPTLISFPVLVLIAAARDLTSYTIPNWISLALVAAFVPAAGAAWAAGAPPLALALSVAVGAGALVAGVAMFSFGWVGGGDAKLMAAAALWLGAPGLTPFLLWTALAGGLLSMVLVVARRTPAGTAPTGWLPRLTTRGEPVPYGVAIAAGALAAFPHGTLGRLAFLPV
jgi:prepilin peptidase CpaA